jgi:enhancing lycopene biosynthesis protein 2
MKKVGVLLSGCGFLDGAEIQESVLALLAIERAGARAICMAPDKDQLHVVNHLTGKEEPDQRRNVLVEAARIARGNIEDVASVTAADLDALVVPGGYGAAKNLSRFAVDGPQGEVDPEVRRLIGEISAARKPLGLICIAPAVGAQVLGGDGVEVTIGNDPGTAAAIETCGARHFDCGVTGIHADPARKVVSTPAYMLGKNILEVSKGIDKLVQTLIDWAS